MSDYFRRGWLLLWLLIIPLLVLFHAPVEYADAAPRLKPVPMPKAVEARVIAVKVVETPTPTPSPSPTPTPTPAPTHAATWRDNPQHCDLSQQLISLTPPFNCVPKTTPKPTVSVASAPKAAPVSGGLHDWYAAAGIPSGDWYAVDYIVSHESGGRINATNPTSGAYGLCQALPGSKMASSGADWRTNPVTQMRWCNSYAHERYGGWGGAYQHWLQFSWW